MQTYKIIIIFYAEIIELYVSNIHPVISNRVIIIGSIIKIFNKGPDEVLVLYGSIFKLLGGCFIKKVLDICVRDVHKVFNTFLAILV